VKRAIGHNNLFVWLNVVPRISNCIFSTSLFGLFPFSLFGMYHGQSLEQAHF